MRDETIVFLELTFHNTSDLLLASRIEQSGHNEKVTEEIRAWAAAHGANVDATVNETAEETTYKITRLERESELSSTGVVSRVLDYWLEQYRSHGHGVFRERLVIDVPLERVSGRHDTDPARVLKPIA